MNYPLDGMIGIPEHIRRMKEEKMKHPHLDTNGEFNSNKYTWCRTGFVPLKITDPHAQPLLWHYAFLRSVVDMEFAVDLQLALTRAGYVPSNKMQNIDEQSSDGCKCIRCEEGGT